MKITKRMELSFSFPFGEKAHRNQPFSVAIHKIPVIRLLWASACVRRELCWYAGLWVSERESVGRLS